MSIVSNRQAVNLLRAKQNKKFFLQFVIANLASVGGGGGVGGKLTST